MGATDSERYKFNEKEDVDITEINYFNVRYYDPKIKRFISKDPIKEGSHWYVYCDKSPLQYVDKEGISKKNTNGVYNTITILGEPTSFHLIASQKLGDFLVDGDEATAPRIGYGSVQRDKDPRLNNMNIATTAPVWGLDVKIRD